VLSCHVRQRAELTTFEPPPRGNARDRRQSMRYSLPIASLFDHWDSYLQAERLSLSLSLSLSLLLVSSRFIERP